MVVYQALAPLVKALFNRKGLWTTSSPTCLPWSERYWFFGKW